MSIAAMKMDNEALRSEHAKLSAENAKLRWQLEVYARANQEYQDRNADLAGVNKKLRAALERLETASGSGEISGSLFKQGEGFIFVGAYIRAALEGK